MVAIGYGVAALLFAGSFLDAINSANSLVSARVTYLGTFVLLVGTMCLHAVLRVCPLRWVTKGQLTRLTGLGVGQVAAVLGVVAVLWIPRVAELTRPTDRAAIRWADLLWNGDKLVVDIGDLPEHARGSLLVEGQSYTVWYQQEPCLWQSDGPAQLPKWMNGDIVEHHYNKTGPPVGAGAHLNPTESATATSDCNSPHDRKMVVLGLPVDFDRRGVFTFGGANHPIGAIRIPPRRRWPWSKN